MSYRVSAALVLILTCQGATPAEQQGSVRGEGAEKTMVAYEPNDQQSHQEPEAARFGAAMTAGVYSGDRLLVPVGAFYGQALAAAADKQARDLVTKQYANQLFESATNTDVTDDRPLYWVRLLMRSTVQPTLARAGASPDESAELISLLEWHSRGMALDDRVTYAREQGVDRFVVITGFDPFFLDVDITQSNPSGLAALALDGLRLEVDGAVVQVVGAIFPVRYQDFDEGLVERFVDGVIDVNPDLLITISMGRDGFDLERFPGLRRSATAPDNRNVLTGASATSPIKAELGGQPIDGPEFVEFSLPATAMTTCDSGPYEVRDNRTVTTLETGQFEASSLAQLEGQTAVEGSGGGYLSNEISYRVLRALQSQGSTVPAGHLHTPRVAGFQPDVEQVIVEQIRELVGCAIRGLERD